MVHRPVETESDVTFVVDDRAAQWQCQVVYYYFVKVIPFLCLVLFLCSTDP